MHAPAIEERSSAARSLTGRERLLGSDKIIVSKTDPKGVLTYVNQTFEEIAGYTEEELLGRAHNIVRHPDMPRCIFKFLWDTIQTGSELFAYVVNRSKNGDHYWVLAHVTATRDEHGVIIGYHSNRRAPTRSALEQIRPVYSLLLAEERKHRLPREQWTASMPIFTRFLTDRKVSYDEFIFSLM